MTKIEDNMDFYNFIQYGQVSTEHEHKKRVLEAQDIMTREVTSLKEDDSIDLFEELAKLERIRHVPVVNSNNKVVGLLTHRDFFNILTKRSQAGTEIKISDIMKKEVKTISKEESLVEVAKIMYKNNYGCLPITENNVLVGIITANDFLKYFSQKDLFLNREE
ncbi:MAG: CBS domain-containing protein [Deltaproteobacteria bacterium]|nr:MAG: CBS domain-containing protein [Deltaproteobacteria bacterium]